MISCLDSAKLKQFYKENQLLKQKEQKREKKKKQLKRIEVKSLFSLIFKNNKISLFICLELQDITFFPELNKKTILILPSLVFNK